MKKMPNLELLGIALVMVSGCAAMRTYHVEPLMKRAAFDLDCPESDLKTHPLDSAWNVMGVTGCGKKATYVSIDSTWYRDTPGSDAQLHALEAERRARQEERRQERHERREEKRQARCERVAASQPQVAGPCE